MFNLYIFLLWYLVHQNTFSYYLFDIHRGVILYYMSWNILHWYVDMMFFQHSTEHNSLRILKKVTKGPSAFSPVWSDTFTLLYAKGRLHSGWLWFGKQHGGVFLIELMEMADRVMVVIVHHFTKKGICSVNRSLCFQPNLMETQKVEESNVPTDTGYKIRHSRDFCANVHQQTSVKANSWEGFGAYPFTSSKHLVVSFSEEQTVGLFCCINFWNNPLFAPPPPNCCVNSM